MSLISEGLWKGYVGRRVNVNERGPGVLMYFGITKKSRDARKCGVALDGGSGKHDGSVNGTRYFTCDPGHGILTAPENCQMLEKQTATGGKILRKTGPMSGGGGGGGGSSGRRSASPPKSAAPKRNKVFKVSTPNRPEQSNMSQSSASPRAVKPFNKGAVIHSHYINVEPDADADAGADEAVEEYEELEVEEVEEEEVVEEEEEAAADEAGGNDDDGGGGGGGGDDFVDDGSGYAEVAVEAEVDEETAAAQAKAAERMKELAEVKRQLQAAEEKAAAAAVASEGLYGVIQPFSNNDAAGKNGTHVVATDRLSKAMDPSPTPSPAPSPAPAPVDSDADRKARAKANLDKIMAEAAQIRETGSPSPAPSSPTPAPAPVAVPATPLPAAAMATPPATPASVEGASGRVMAHVKGDFTAAKDNQVSIKAGEIVEVLDDTKRWWIVMKSDGTKGKAPSNFLKLIPASVVQAHAAKLATPVSSPTPAPAPVVAAPVPVVAAAPVVPVVAPAPAPAPAPAAAPAPAPASADDVYVAVADFAASKGTQLTLSRGEILTIADPNPTKNWWLAKNDRGEEGKVASNYVKKQ